MTSGTGNEACASAGFTLIEVLVATVILFSGLVAVLSAFSSAVMALDQASDVLAATQLVEEKACEVELEAGPDREQLHSSSGIGVAPYARYTWDVTVRGVSTFQGAGLCNIDISAGRDKSSNRRLLVTQWAQIIRPPVVGGGAPP